MQLSESEEAPAPLVVAHNGVQMAEYSEEAARDDQPSEPEEAPAPPEAVIAPAQVATARIDRAPARHTVRVTCLVLPTQVPAALTSSVSLAGNAPDDASHSTLDADEPLVCALCWTELTPCSITNNYCPLRQRIGEHHRKKDDFFSVQWKPHPHPFVMPVMITA